MSFSVTSPMGTTTNAWRQLRWLCGDRKASIGVLALASIAAGLAEASVLALVAAVAAAMVVHAGHVAGDLGPLGLRPDIGLALTLCLVLGVVRLLLQLVIAWMPARISAEVQAELRHAVFDAFVQASWAMQAQENEGYLQELMTDQINEVTQVITQLVSALSGGAMFLALVLAAFVLNAAVAAIVLATAAAIFWVLRPIAVMGGRAGRDLSRSNMDHAAGISEAVRLAEDAHVFGVVAAEQRRVRRLIATVQQAFFRYQLMGGLSRGLYQSLVILLIVIGLGGLYVARAGDLVALGAVVLMLVRSASYAQQFQGGYQALVQMLPYLDRLEGSVDRYRAAAVPSGDCALERIETLAMEGVRYAYGAGRSALNDVSFTVEAGESVGIIGRSGAGKSTLVQLLLALRTPDRGEYLINGEPITSFRRVDWQRHVAYVSQDPRIMRASVAENIRFYRDLDDATINQAARMAHIHDDIMHLPLGYNTIVGQVADALSGGQRQRICLARALAGKPDVLVLDEPTSALDAASEAAVQQTLAELRGALTLFVVSHRVSAIKGCDRALVLVDGSIEAFVSPAELPNLGVSYEAASSTAAHGVA